MTMGLPRARQELAAARVLIEQGFPAQAVSRSYYAAFYAAEAALLLLGETRSKLDRLPAEPRIPVVAHSGPGGPNRFHTLPTLPDTAFPTSASRATSGSVDAAAPSR